MKTKKYISFFILFFLCFVCFILSINLICQSNTVEAATTPRYTVTFSYKNTKRVSSMSSGNKDTVYKQGTNVTSASVMNNTGSSMTLKAYLYGDNYSGSGTLSNGGYVSSTTVNISFDSTYTENTITVTNSSGAQVKKVTSSKSITLTGLSVGENYKVSYSGFGPGIGTTVMTSYLIDACFTFQLDLTAPTMTGCSTSYFGTKSNKEMTVYALDDISGVKYVYRKGPNDSGYSVQPSYTMAKIYENEASGIYEFYAVDYAGLKSQTYYALFDNLPPVGTIYDVNNNKISATYYNGAFYYTATDIGYGVDYYQYKSPGTSTWLAYTSGSEISATATNGWYTFRAIDGLNNVSEESSIYLDTIAPTGKVYANSAVLENGGSTSATSIYYSATDAGGIAKCYVKGPSSSNYIEYSNGSALTESGKYSFYCVDLAGLTSEVYSIFMDHDAPYLTCDNAVFYESYNNTFKVSAFDAVSDVTLYYKTPLHNDFIKADTNSVSVQITSPDGRYYFYAVDTYSNTTQIYFIDLTVNLPVAMIVNSDTDNRIYITWDNPNINAKVNGNNYTKNTWMSEEGNYVLHITDSYTTRENSYSFTIGHYYVQGETILPTCILQGYTIYECISCDDFYFDDFIPAKGHKYNSTTYPPSCLNQGYTVYVCSVCNYTYTGDYTQVLGHYYEREIVSPTCTEQGYTISTCSRCNYIYLSDYVEALGHDFEVIEFEPTCTVKGGMLYKCKRCDYEYTVYLESELGHKYYTEQIEPTCEDEGYIKHKCVQCEYVYQTDITKALGHDFNTWVSKHADCANDGERVKSCSRCDKSIASPIPCQGHKYSIKETQTDNDTKRLYVCDVCGDEYVEYLGNQYEMVSNYVDDLFDQYAKYMIWVFIATSGVWSIAMGIAYIIAYRNEDKQKARKMLVNYGIGMIAIFAILVACPYLIKGIIALVS